MNLWLTRVRGEDAADSRPADERPVTSYCRHAALVMLLALAGCRAAGPNGGPTLPRQPTLAPTGVSGALTSAPVTTQDRVLPPQVAGSFYPGPADELERVVRELLRRAPANDSGRRPLGLVAPHAGYIYSGEVAAAAYRQAEGQAYDVIVLIGTNHVHAGFQGIAVYPSGAMATPLGNSVIDAELAARLVAAGSPIVGEPAMFVGEHSVEVQLPFLQTLFPDTPIVALLIGWPTAANVDALVDALSEALAERRPLLVASSDLAHYPAASDAEVVDRSVLEAIVSMDPDRLRGVIAEQMARNIPNLDTCACGESAILTVMRVAKALGARDASIIEHRTSADVPYGDPSRVVGYGAVAFWAAAPPEALTPEAAQRTPSAPVAASPTREPDLELSNSEQAALLRLARSTIERYLRDGLTPEAPRLTARLRREQGAFVTLTRDGELRGCMGSLTARLPLYLQVQESALMAALSDPRFPPVTLDELPKLRIEISALGPLELVADISQIEVGKHGLLIEKDGRSGTLLPQVPLEYGWDRDQFLVQLCRKAGLPDDAWRTAKLYRYTAQVFHE